MNTSIDSYKKCHEDGIIGDKQNAVLRFILETREQFSDGHSRGDVGRHFDDPNTGYQRRLQELEELKILTCIGTKHDSITNRDVKAYKPTGIVPTERKKTDPTVTYIACWVAREGQSPIALMFPKKNFEDYVKYLTVLDQQEVTFKCSV